MNRKDKEIIIRYYIEKNIEHIKRSKIAIYPYGTIGCMIDEILKKDYGVISDICVDNNRKMGNIISVNKVDTSEYMWIVGTDYRWLANMLCHDLKGGSNIIQIVTDYQNQMLVNNRMEHLGIQVTNRCNLRCKYCADLCRYRLLDDYRFDDIVEDIKKLFSVIEGADEVLIIGGETLLYKQLGELMGFIRNEIPTEKIIIASNGTIEPDDDLLRCMRDNNVVYRVSGYNNMIAPKRSEFIYKAKSLGVECEDMDEMHWYDIGTPNKRNRTKEELTDVFCRCSMKKCVSIFHGNLSYCSREAAAIETNIYPHPLVKEYIDVRNIPTEKLKEKLNAFYSLTEISVCDYCDGIDYTDPVGMKNREVSVAEQI